MPVTSKISKTQGEEIARRYASGEAIGTLAKEFNVTWNSISKRCRPISTVIVLNEGKEQTYRENLNWAMNAAGEFLRAKRRPHTCPNDSAWFLYCQAIDEPKDFMAKVGQVELKSDNGESDRMAKVVGQRSVTEIDEMLNELRAE